MENCCQYLTSYLLKLSVKIDRNGSFRINSMKQLEQEGLAVASIARDVVEMTPTRDDCAVNLDQNMKRKLAIMRQCTFVTERQTDGH